MIDQVKDNARAVINTSRLVFLLCGLEGAAWAALIPLTQVRLSLSPLVLGAMIFAVGVGALLAMMVAGSLAVRWGCRKILLPVVPAAFVVLIAILFCRNAWQLAAVTFTLGVLVGFIDVVMNIQAGCIEQRLQRHLMSGFHGMYSLGNLLGALLLSALLAWGVPLLTVLLFGAVLVLVLVPLCAPYLLPYGRVEAAVKTGDSSPQAEKKARLQIIRPRGVVWLLGGLCLLLYLSEGIILDWGGLFMHQQHNASLSVGSLPLAAFAITCTLARLTGDRWIAAWGLRYLMIGGALLALGGFVLVVLAPHGALSYLGFALVGLGAGNLIPQVFSLAGRQQDMPANLAIASVSAMGFSGLLIGPAAMGWLAEHTSIQAIFIACVLFMVLVTWGVSRAFRYRQP